MNVMIMATKNCSHCKNFSRELDDIGIEHDVVYCDDNPELVQKYGIRHSPNMIVNGEVVFRKQPTEGELKEFFNC
ncbi:MAG: thioredoxin family protein [Thiotrichaceae bacterium]|nr:MAG: thioredoxin family protein [Thiotrichaceae bacterium]